MKKAVISTGGKQYLVTEGDTIAVELLQLANKKNVSFDALLVMDNDTVKVGTPLVKDIKVKANIVAASQPAQKVTAVRYKAKKRVHKIHGHRQKHSIIKITNIS